MIMETTGGTDYKDRRIVLIGIGAFLLLIGIPTAFLGPAEMYCFYLFSEGGRFYYEGFGFGSFMFGNIACQIAGYYLIAAVCILLGYGHLRIRRWARTLTLTLLWFWLVTGVPLSVVFLFVLVTAKDPSLLGALIALLFAGLSYSVIPGLLIWFYRSRHVRMTFESRDPKPHWTDGVPLPVLVLSSLFTFYIIALHVPILFNGIFPLFGVWLFGLPGIVVIDVAIMLLVCLLWGVLKLRKWAWWGSLIYFGLIIPSVLLTLAGSSLPDILSKTKFAPIEMEALGGMPLHGIHLAMLIGIPLLMTLGLLVVSRRYFGTGGRPEQAGNR
jgi:hypothetical protein